MRPQSLGQKKKLEIQHHHIICRGDIPDGHKFAQVGHAVAESCEGPMPNTTYIYVLEAKDESHIDELHAKLWDLEIPHTVIHEPDAPYNGQAMAIGIWPVIDRTDVKKVTSSLPLLGKKK